MAIRDGIKNAVASNIGAAVNRTVSSSLRRVAGNLFGVDLVPGRGTAGGPTTPIRKPNKYTTKNLAYPTGVEADPTQGHYIIFEILAQNPGKLKAFEKKAQKVKEDHVVTKKREERERNWGKMQAMEAVTPRRHSLLRCNAVLGACSSTPFSFLSFIVSLIVRDVEQGSPLSMFFRI